MGRFACGMYRYALVARKGIFHVQIQWLQQSLKNSVGFSSLKSLAVPHADRRDTAITRVSVTTAPASSRLRCPFVGSSISADLSCTSCLQQHKFCLLTQTWSTASGRKFLFHHHDPVNMHRTARKLVPNGRIKSQALFMSFEKKNKSFLINLINLVS